MGRNASIILYPLEGVAPAAPDLDSKIREVILALERANVVADGVSLDVEMDRETTFVTADLDEDEDGSESEHTWSHAYVEPRNLSFSVRDLVYSATEEVWSEETSPALKDELAVPLLDVTVFDGPLTVIDDTDEEISTWAFVEFSYEDARYDPEKIHTIRNDAHRAFTELKRAFGSEVGWSVIPG
jgi:hypothetical protein